MSNEKVVFILLYTIRYIKYSIFCFLTISCLNLIIAYKLCRFVYTKTNITNGTDK